MSYTLKRDHSTGVSAEQSRWYSLAYYLALFTILYNIAEGMIATLFGYQDESLTLFGFGADSFIEVISGIGIAHMVLRIKKHPHSPRAAFEKKALQVTGTAFYLLVLTLITTGVYNIVQGHQPTTTFWGLVISSISILIMWFSILWKTKLGKALNSEAILADAECAKICIYMSVILLVSSAIFEWTGFYYIDSIGALGLAFLSYREGKECFEKARSEKYCSCDH